MEFEVSYDLDDPQQFWDELDEIVSVHCETHVLIDNALRAYLHFTTKFKEEYLQSEYDIARCTYKLLGSALFEAHKDYVRRQILYSLLQEDDAPTLHLIAAFLLFDGRDNEPTFEMMQQEGAFPRLVELIQRPADDDVGLHRMLLQLMYEMSRIQRLSREDLMAVDDAFVLHLFQIIEELSDDVNDPYHYPVIRVLLVLNEQYLMHSMPTPTDPSTPPLTNRVIKTLATHGASLKTFGENLILLLNRESETSLQLLILKLLYLLFQSPQTAEYFYTNDLHVLLDVVLRNLLDLPAGSAPAAALRHTYLRVLHPLLANSQLRRPGGHYKRGEVRKLLRVLEGDAESGAGTHFAPVDATTVRLVRRCRGVEWLRDAPVGDAAPAADAASTKDESGNTTDAAAAAGGEAVAEATDGAGDSLIGGGAVGVGDGQRELARRMLGMSVREGGESALSMVAVAAHREKPGVQTPSRHKDAAAVGYAGGRNGL